MGGWVGGRMGIRGQYRFSSLVKQKKKEKNYAVLYFTGKRIFFYIYDVITWGKQKKGSANYY
jgi:hypothetical protein